LPGTDKSPQNLGGAPDEGRNKTGAPFLSPYGRPRRSSSVSQRTMSRWRKLVRTKAEQCAPDDLLVESAVLDYVITERPEGVSIPMLALRFNAEFDQGVSGLAVERAVRELVRDGYLRMHGGKVVLHKPRPGCHCNRTGERRSSRFATVSPWDAAKLSRSGAAPRIRIASHFGSRPIRLFGLVADLEIHSRELLKGLVWRLGEVRPWDFERREEGR
jgi:hypothetical protein